MDFIMDIFVVEMHGGYCTMEKAPDLLACWRPKRKIYANALLYHCNRCSSFFLRCVL